MSIDFTPYDDDFEGLDPDDDLAFVEDAEDLADAGIFVRTGTPVPPLGRSWSYDFNQMRFTPNYGGPAKISGEAALRQWIQKALITWRASAPVHPNDYGMNDPTMGIGRAIIEISESEIQREVEGCLTYHPRITAVEDLAIERDMLSERIEISFTVVLDGDTDILDEDDAGRTPLSETLRFDRLTIGI